VDCVTRTNMAHLLATRPLNPLVQRNLIFAVSYVFVSVISKCVCVRVCVFVCVCVRACVCVCVCFTNMMKT